MQDDVKAQKFLSNAKLAAYQFEVTRLFEGAPCPAKMPFATGDEMGLFIWKVYGLSFRTL